jgi:hypothetical protein
METNNQEHEFTEADLYSKEQYEKIERLRKMSSYEQHQKSTNKNILRNYNDPKHGRYKSYLLSELEIGDRFYWKGIVSVVVDKFRDRIESYWKSSRKYKIFETTDILMVERMGERFQLSTNTFTLVRKFFPEDLSHIIVRDEFKKMPTRELLVRYRGRYIGWNPYGDEHMDDSYYLEMKAELNTREHIPNKKEAKAIRRAKAKRK